LFWITTMAENAEKSAPLVPEEAQPETSFEDSSEQETKEEATTEETTTKELPARPIKRARTAYFIFADDKRAEIAAQVSLFFTKMRNGSRWNIRLIMPSHYSLFSIRAKEWVPWPKS
jgi:hypothetical protein